MPLLDPDASSLSVHAGSPGTPFQNSPSVVPPSYPCTAPLDPLCCLSGPSGFWGLPQAPRCSDSTCPLSPCSVGGPGLALHSRCPGWLMAEERQPLRQQALPAPGSALRTPLSLCPLGPRVGSLGSGQLHPCSQDDQPGGEEPKVTLPMSPTSGHPWRWVRAAAPGGPLGTLTSEIFRRILHSGFL